MPTAKAADPGQGVPPADDFGVHVEDTDVIEPPQTDDNG
jgi:hypothetical protein